jgi:copper chaperone CopZ
MKKLHSLVLVFVSFSLAAGVSAAPADSKLAKKGETVVLSVRKMHCSGCASKVEKAVKAAGFESEKIAVDVEKKQATFVCASAQCDVSKVEAAVTKLGYPTSWVR